MYSIARLREIKKYTTLCHDICINTSDNEYKYNLADHIITQYYDNVYRKKIVRFVSSQLLSVLVQSRTEIAAQTCITVHG